jgi:hypothetical protein
VILKAIEAAGFRGIPRRLRVNLQPERSQQPLSLILYGDNGTGKSSIVDAIEFALQSRVSRTKSIGAPGSPSLRSFSTNTDCSVKAELTDNTCIERQLICSDDDICLSSYAPHPQFAFSPFVLRRSDVLQFHETPEVQRQLIFFDVFRTPQDGWGDNPKDEFEGLITKRLQLRHRKQELRESVSDLLHWDMDVVPQEKDQILEFVRLHFYRGMSQNNWKQAVLNGLACAVPPATEQLIKDFIQATEELAAVNGRIKKYGNFKLASAARPVIKEVLTHISGEVTGAFSSLSNAKFVNSVLITHSDLSDVSLSVKLRLSNSVVCDPRQILSEANLDLLAFLLYLAAMKESSRRGQAKLLILDDVFQSVDSTIRVSVVDYILSDMRDWQIVITAHDRMWKEQVKDLFRRYGRAFVEQDILRWDFEQGPVLRDGGQEMDKLLLDSLDRGDPVAICSYAGWVLEAICNRLSWAIPISVLRRRDDKYTLGDLWPSVHKFLRKTNRTAESCEVEKWCHLRNLVGAHHNNWAIILADHEAQAFGQAVLSLLRFVRCTACGSWVEAPNDRSDRMVCRCGSIAVEKT